MLQTAYPIMTDAVTRDSLRTQEMPSLPNQAGKRVERKVLSETLDLNLCNQNLMQKRI